MSSIVATSTTIHRPGERQLSLPATTLAAGAAAAAAATAAAAAFHGAGVSLAAEGAIPLPAFAQFVLVGALIGGVLAAVMNRRSARPRHRFVQVTAGLTLLSCAPPVAMGDTAGSKIALVATHLVAAGIIVPVLARRVQN